GRLRKCQVASRPRDIESEWRDEQTLRQAWLPPPVPRQIDQNLAVKYDNQSHQDGGLQPKNAAKVTAGNLAIFLGTARGCGDSHDLYLKLAFPSPSRLPAQRLI